MLCLAKLSFKTDCDHPHRWPYIENVQPTEQLALCDIRARKDNQTRAGNHSAARFGKQSAEVWIRTIAPKPPLLRPVPRGPLLPGGGHMPLKGVIELWSSSLLPFLASWPPPVLPIMTLAQAPRQWGQTTVD